MDRKTEVLGPQSSDELLTDPDEKARVESQNALEQFDYAIDFVEQKVFSGEQFVLDSAFILELNRVGNEGRQRERRKASSTSG